MNKRHVHYLDENGIEKSIPVNWKAWAYTKYRSLKRKFDEVRVTDEDGEYCDESEL